MRASTSIAVSFLALSCALAACQRTSPASPTAGAGEPGPRTSGGTGAEDTRVDTLSVGIGQTRQVDGGALAVELRAVENDSRCPVNVTCVWQGDVSTRLGITAGGDTQEATLHTGVDPRATTVGAYRVELAHVAPTPVQGEQPDPRAYVAVLVVRRK